LATIRDAGIEASGRHRDEQIRLVGRKGTKNAFRPFDAGLSEGFVIGGVFWIKRT